MENKLAILFSMILLLAPSVVSADVIMPGQKGVSWCYEISNIGDYPDYVFIVSTEYPLAEYEIIDEGCFTFYKNGQASVYAIPKNEFNESELSMLSYSVRLRRGDEEPDPREIFENYLEQNFLKSDITLEAFGTVPEDDPLKDVVITLQIRSLDENTFDVDKSMITYTYADGTSEEKVFQRQDVLPDRSKKAFPFLYIVISVIAIAAIALISRKFRK